MPTMARSSLNSSKTDLSRAKANALRQAFQLVAMIISIALTPVVVDAIGWSMTAIIYGVLGGAVILYIPSPAVKNPLARMKLSPKSGKASRRCLPNRKFWGGWREQCFLQRGDVHGHGRLATLR